jgi:hypothetical protein
MSIRTWSVAGLGLILAGCSGSPTTPSVPPTAAVPQGNVQTAPPSVPIYTLADVTLSGMITEVTPTGQVPLEGVSVYCEPCGEITHSWASTDPQGAYSFRGVWVSAGTNTFSIWVTKEGYQDPPGLNEPGWPHGPGWRNVTVNGNTRLDVQLVRP